MGAADDMRTLAIELAEVPKGSGPRLRKALEVSARHMRDDARENVRDVAGHRLRHTAGSIDYDIRSLGVTRAGTSGYEAEIGPNRGRRQGPMAGWFEEGSVDGVPASYPLASALEANAADFEYGVQRAIEDTLRAAGL